MNNISVERAMEGAERAWLVPVKNFAFYYAIYLSIQEDSAEAKELKMLKMIAQAKPANKQEFVGMIKGIAATCGVWENSFLRVTLINAAETQESKEIISYIKEKGIKTREEMLENQCKPHREKYIKYAWSSGEEFFETKIAQGIISEEDRKLIA